jgi:hypothetical protein
VRVIDGCGCGCVAVALCTTPSSALGGEGTNYLWPKWSKYQGGYWLQECVPCTPRFRVPISGPCARGTRSLSSPSLANALSTCLWVGGWLRLQDLFAGTSKASSHLPGYSGHIAESTFGRSGAAALQSTTLTQKDSFLTHTNLDLTTNHRVPGYVWGPGGGGALNGVRPPRLVGGVAQPDGHSPMGTARWHSPPKGNANCMKALLAPRLPLRERWVRLAACWVRLQVHGPHPQGQRGAGAVRNCLPQCRPHGAVRSRCHGRCCGVGALPGGSVGVSTVVSVSQGTRLLVRRPEGLCCVLVWCVRVVVARDLPLRLLSGGSVLGITAGVGGGALRNQPRGLLNTERACM